MVENYSPDMLRLEQCLCHVRGVCFMTTENVWFKCILGHCGGELGSTMKLVEKVTCNRAYHTFDGFRVMVDASDLF